MYLRSTTFDGVVAFIDGYDASRDRRADRGGPLRELSRARASQVPPGCRGRCTPVSTAKPARHPVFAVYTDCRFLLPVLAQDGGDDYTERDTTTLALVREHATAEESQWSAAVIVVYLPMLLRLPKGWTDAGRQASASAGGRACVRRDCDGLLEQTRARLRLDGRLASL